MNWEAIKYIYFKVLVQRYEIEYLGKDRYKLIYRRETGRKSHEKRYKNKLLEKVTWWQSNGQKRWEEEWKNGIMFRKIRYKNGKQIK